MKKKQYTAGQWAMMVAAAILIVAGSLGAALMLLYLTLKYGTDIHGEDTKKLAGAAFWWMAGACLVLCGISAAAAKKADQLRETWDREESEKMDRLGNLLDILSYLFELFFVLLYMAAGFRIFVEMPGLQEDGEWMKQGIFLAGFILAVILLAAFQRNLQAAQKRLAEREGSHVYSNGFFSKNDLKEWLKKSDEGEQQLVYKAAFRTYRIMIRILFFAMAAISFTKLPGPVTITAFTVISIIWIIMSTCFCIERYRLRRGKLR